MEPYNCTFELVDPYTIVIDHRYQRDLRPALVAAIASDPRWELFGVPVLFRRDEGAHSVYYCADGQQRIEGIKRSQNPPRLIPAVWFPVSHLADEAAVFVHINEFRRQLVQLAWKEEGRQVAIGALSKHESEMPLDAISLSTTGKETNGRKLLHR